MWIALALLLSVLWRRWGVLFMTLFAVAVSDWLAMGLKALVDRPRPPLRYVEPKVLVPLPHDASFPSGHATNAFALASVVAAHSDGWLIPTLAYSVASGVAASRMNDNAHWASDVVAGALIGASTGRFIAHRHRKANRQAVVTLVPLIGPRRVGLSLRAASW